MSGEGADARPLRVLELFSGIGGCAAAVHTSSGAADEAAAPRSSGPAAVVVGAVDQDRQANAVYACNFGLEPSPMNLDRVRPDRLARFGADLWWMSPPCQPHTVRGRRRDLDDPRARSFVAVLAAVEAVRPARLALENVPGFAGSRAHGLLREVLERSGYAVGETVWCPTEAGVPMRRRRYLLAASLDPAALPALARSPATPAPNAARPPCHGPLSAYLRPDPADALFVDPDLLARYAGVMNVVDAEDPAAVAECFTSAYGRTPLHAGSYLRQDGRIRRFSPEEIAGLMGFGPGFAFPPGLTLRQRWSLVGNAVAPPAARLALGLAPPR